MDLHSRREDMSCCGELTIAIQPDGDIIIICSRSDMSGEISCGEVEFCSLSGGGGRSPNTREALMKLIEAIEKDNKEHPID